MSRLTQPSQDQARPGGPSDDKSGPGNGPPGRQRSVAQRVTFGISLLIVAGVVALIAYQQVAGGNRPPAIDVQWQLQNVRQEAGVYYVPVEVTNRGDATAEDVRIRPAFAAGGDRRELAELVIPFLAGGDTVEGTIALPEDPARGTLTITSISFMRP